MLLVDDGKLHDVFEVVDLVDGVVRARSAYLFEIGEVLTIRIEHDGAVSEAVARVRAHVGGDDKITELELSQRKAVSG